jgi:hypothetical protein
MVLLQKRQSLQKALKKKSIDLMLFQFKISFKKALAPH